jgi:hypothetical protein
MFRRMDAILEWGLDGGSLQLYICDSRTPGHGRYTPQTRGKTLTTMASDHQHKLNYLSFLVAY